MPVFNGNSTSFIASNNRGRVGLYDVTEWNVSWLDGFDVKKNDWQAYKKVKYQYLVNDDRTAPKWIVTSIDNKGVYISNGETLKMHAYLDGYQYTDHFQLDGQFFLITRQKSNSGDYSEAVWQLDSMQKVLDDGDKVNVNAATRTIASRDSNNALRFYAMHEYDKQWTIEEREPLTSLVPHISFSMWGSNRILGFINNRFLLLEHDDSLSVVDVQLDSFYTLFSTHNLDNVEIVQSSDGDNFISLIAQDEEFNEKYYKIYFNVEKGFQTVQTSQAISDGIWEKKLDVWIYTDENNLAYSETGELSKSSYVGGKVVSPEGSDFIDLQANNFSSGYISILCDDGKVRIYDPTRGNLLRTISSDSGRIVYAKNNVNHKFLVTITHYRDEYYSNSHTEVWNIADGTKIRERSNRYRNVAATISADGKTLYYIDDDEYLRKLDLEADTLISREFVGSVYDLEINKQGDLMLLSGYSGSTLWSLDSFTRVNYFVLSSGVVFSPTGNEVLSMGTVSGIEEFSIRDTILKIGEYRSFLDTANGNYEFIEAHTQRVVEAAYSPDGKYIISAGLDGNLIMWDRATQKMVHKKTLNVGRVNGLSFSPDGSMYVASSIDQRVKIWESEKNRELATIVLLKDDASITFTPESYYYATGDVSQYMSWQVGDKFLSFEQMDLKYNRPDLVLASLNSPDTNLIKAYHLAYQKRLSRLNVAESSFSEMLPPPELNLSSRGFEEFQVDQSYVDIRFEAYDEYTPLTTLNVWMNGVPLYGVGGTSVSTQGSHNLDTTIRVDLINGLNKIEASVLNERGLESIREPFFVREVDSSVKSPKIYFVGIAMDDYEQNDWNLQYSVKDIRDLVRAMSARHTDMVIDTLFNSSVTSEAIDAILDKLALAHPNDKLIISFSGHGLLSDQFDYYLSTYPIDFANPQQFGYAYDKLEDKLARLKIRRRLLMIDACHSGEVDKTSLLALNDLIDQKNLKGATIIEQEDDLSHLGLKNSFDLMNDLFLKVGNETGTVVISAAAGTQFAYEDGILSNGVFTYSVLELLKSSNDISISDLQKWVKKRVPELTSGAQNPTSRSVNYSLDWNF